MKRPKQTTVDKLRQQMDRLNREAYQALTRQDWAAVERIADELRALIHKLREFEALTPKRKEDIQ